jgi:hypothetical protein
MDYRLGICKSKGTAIPVQAWTGPNSSRRLRLPDFKTISTWWCWDCQPYTPATFTPQDIFLILIPVRGWVNLRAIVRPEGLCQWKIPVTSLGIKPMTFQLVVQCLNQLCCHMSLAFVPSANFMHFTWRLYKKTDIPFHLAGLSFSLCYTSIPNSINIFHKSYSQSIIHLKSCISNASHGMGMWSLPSPIHSPTPHSPTKTVNKQWEKIRKTITNTWNILPIKIYCTVPSQL